MKKSLLTLALGLSLWAPATAQNEAKQLQEAWTRVSRLQAMIEYFYLEAGFYPLSLEELDQLLNSKAPRGASRLAIPKDPATNQSFVYALDKTGRRYQLTVPDPAKYGGAKPLVSSMDWGFLGDMAALRRFEEVVRHTTNQMKAVATQCELYAKDHQGQFPAALDDLMPKYLARFPTDPVTNKNLLYKKIPAGYVIACPNPERYGFKIFQYSSVSGMQIEQLPPKGKDAAAPKEAPKEQPAPGNTTTPEPPK